MSLVCVIIQLGPTQTRGGHADCKQAACTAMRNRVQMVASITKLEGYSMQAQKQGQSSHRAPAHHGRGRKPESACTAKFGSATKVLAELMLKYSNSAHAHMPQSLHAMSHGHDKQMLRLEQTGIS